MKNASASQTKILFVYCGSISTFLFVMKLQRFVLLTVCILASCSTVEKNKPTVLMISLDGFRWDYVDKVPTPNFHRLIDSGVRAKRMLPVFPSKTFPNHYTLVTGLYIEHHGIVSNRMWDPDLKASFVYKDSVSSQDPRWWGGEPIWVTAEKQGLITATYFWVGSETEIAGKRPTYFKKYDHQKPDSERVDEVLDWLDLPAEKRPSLITLYFALTDDVGHEFGPESDEIKAAIEQVDQTVGRLIDGLEKRGIFEKVDLIIVSDHGMCQVNPENVVFLDDYVDLKKLRPNIESPIFGLWPEKEQVDNVYQKLVSANPHMKVYKKEDMPPEFHYSQHPRIPPIVGMVDEGWSLTTHSFQKKYPRTLLGTHGLDPALPSMGATFIAHGPGFKKGVLVEPFRNIHVYDLIAHLLNIRPASNDGSLDSIRQVLSNP